MSASRIRTARRFPALGDIEMINAVTLVTAAMDTSCGFYDSLGFERIVGGAGREFTTYRVGPGFLNVQLDLAHAPVPAIWGRVIFWVADVDEMYERALRHGHVPEMPPSDAPWGERYFHLRDPDGHELSFAKPLA
jgi:catechol 2,3-dioxygenase-like lactoylglutathione lyase family enzyme